LRFEASAALFSACYLYDTGPVLTRQVHLATPRTTASTVAKAAVTQVMFRRFDVTTEKNPDPSGGFDGLTFLGGFPSCCIAGFLRAMVIPVS
jgi:hypothetical protein